MSTVVGDLSYNEARERIRLVLSFVMFKAMRILILKFRNPKELHLITLMSLLAASNLALE